MFPVSSSLLNPVPLIFLGVISQYPHSLYIILKECNLKQITLIANEWNSALYLRAKKIPIAFQNHLKENRDNKLLWGACKVRIKGKVTSKAFHL